MNYKIIFLIISSDNENVYSQMKNLSPKYYNLYSNKIKYFFIENISDSQKQDVIEDGNFLYINELNHLYQVFIKNLLKQLNILIINTLMIM